jgi:hypothetical protein
MQRRLRGRSGAVISARIVVSSRFVAAEVIMKAERLQDEFSAERVPCNEQLLLLRAADAVALVDYASEEGVPIVAVEGVRVSDQGIESLIEHIADYSTAVAGGHGCWAEAEAFIRARAGSDLVFAVRLGGDPIELV